MELIKALLNVVAFVNIAHAVRDAGIEAGYVNVWGDYAWTGPAPLQDATEWLRKPVHEEIVSGQVIKGWDEDEEYEMEYDDVVGYVEHDTARIESLDGYQVLDVEAADEADIDEWEKLAREDDAEDVRIRYADQWMKGPHREGDELQPVRSVNAGPSMDWNTVWNIAQERSLERRCTFTFVMV